MSSRAEQEPGSDETLDALVLAGSRGSPAFGGSAGQHLPKAVLELGGEPMVRRVVRAVLGAQGVGRVYAVGDPALLARALGPVLRRFGSRLQIVPEGQDLLDNCLTGFFDHLLPGRGYPQAAGLARDRKRLGEFVEQHPEAVGLGALVVPSDLPFVAAEDVERFLALAPAGVALSAGLCDHAELEQMQLALGRQTVLDRWKLGAIPLRRVEVRWNNLWLARPLMADPVVYQLLQQIYARRWLLDQDGRILWRNWWAILGALARASWRVRGRLRFLRGLGNALGIMLATGLARLARRAGRWLTWPFRLLLRQRDLEFVASLLLGAPARTVLSAGVAPAIDIDVEESYQALAAGGEENYRRVARYLGRLPDSAARREPDARPGLQIITGGKTR